MYSLPNSRGDLQYWNQLSTAFFWCGNRVQGDGWLAMAGRRTGMPVNGQSTAWISCQKSAAKLDRGDSQSQLLKQVTHNCCFITIIIAKIIATHCYHFAILWVDHAGARMKNNWDDYNIIVVISETIIIDTNQRTVNILIDVALTVASPFNDYPA
jgi:hypothetical protein